MPISGGHEVDEGGETFPRIKYEDYDEGKILNEASIWKRQRAMTPMSVMSASDIRVAHACDVGRRVLNATGMRRAVGFCRIGRK